MTRLFQSFLKANDTQVYMPGVNIFRRLALAKALAEGMPEREIVRKFSAEFWVKPHSLRIMLGKLKREWTREPIKYRSYSLSPWKTSAKSRARMSVLHEALKSGAARGEVVRRYAAQWALSTEWVDELITRVIAETQHEIHEQAQRELAIYVARIRAQLVRSTEARDHAASSGAYEELARLDPRTGA